MTPNSRVSRTVQIEANGSSLASFLTRLAMDTPCLPVKVLFDSNGATCWSMNAGKTVMLFANEWSIEGLKVKEPCVLVFDPKEMSDIVRSKSRGDTVRITTTAGEPIEIVTKTHGGASILPANEDDCYTIPDRNRMPVGAKGEVLFPMFDNEPATSTGLITVAELRKALLEMTTANASYVSISFDKKAEARSGHWGSKTTKSWCPIECEFSGSPFTISLTDSLNTVLSLLDTTTTQVKVSKHHKGQFVVFESIDGQNTTIVCTEAVKEV